MEQARAAVHCAVSRSISVLSDKVDPRGQLNPLVWALPLQVTLLFSNLDLLDPWGDEWFALNIVSRPISQIVSDVAGNIHPPFYFVLLHYWIQLPWTLSLAASVRAMSAAWALVATVVIYALWLRREEPRLQKMFFALWALSPCLLLHARMARSYSMQLALASLAIYTAPRWAEQPRNWKWLLAYIGSSAALLYTHYLSGLAIAAGVCVTFLLKRRFILAATQVALLTTLYAPWVPVLASKLGQIGSSYQFENYEGGSLVSDQIVRFAYLFVSFSFGETFSAASALLSLALTPVVIYALLRAETRRTWLPLVLVAMGIAWIGVSTREQFVFMPAQLFFVLPFFLILILRQMHPWAFVALLVVYAAGDYAYFTSSGFLVKPYAIPYKEVADVIREGSRGQNAIVAVDTYSASTALPLLNRLGHSVPVIFLTTEASAREALETARSEQSRPSVVWLWRRTSDTSPGSFVSKFEQDLSAGREVRRREFVRYSVPERCARRLLRGLGQPEYYYRLSEFR
jgi:hypothetical protein